MRKIKFFMETNDTRAYFEEIVEIDDNATDEEIIEKLENWKEDLINYGYERVTER